MPLRHIVAVLRGQIVEEVLRVLGHVAVDSHLKQLY